MEEPKLSVLITTFNHEAYIEQAVHSALAQQTSFPFEIVIGEDASTDVTRKIVSELAQRHPEKIRLLLHERNLGGPANVAAVLAACRGQYVAMLEGDDYWTSVHKLQKQVAALDSHPDWSMCFHPVRMVFEDSSRSPRIYPARWTKAFATVDDLFVENFIGTCSTVFRRQALGKLPEWHREILPGDWAIHILNADRGFIGFLPEAMADYRVHSHGAWSSKPHADCYVEILRMFKRVDQHFQGKYSPQIEAYRRRLVTRLADNVDRLEKLSADLRAKVNSLRTQQLVSVPGRSPIYRLSRTVMRPVERVGRRVVAAIGIRRKAG